jgi:hypothetical protein
MEIPLGRQPGSVTLALALAAVLDSIKSYLQDHIALITDSQGPRVYVNAGNPNAGARPAAWVASARLRGLLTVSNNSPTGRLAPCRLIPVSSMPWFRWNPATTLELVRPKEPWG